MKNAEKTNYELMKYTRWYELLNAWLCVKNNYAANFEDYFNDNNFRHIAIYGCGELGCRLFEELQHTDIKVLYMIDQNAKNIRYKCEVVSVNEFAKSEEIDAVIVSPVQSFKTIKECLKKIRDVEIVSLEEVINYYVF